MSNPARRPALALSLLLLLLLVPGLALAAICDGFYAAGYQLTEGKLNPPTSALSKPAKGARLREPNFGTCLFRATAHASEPPQTFARNDYSRRQAFNADNTYFIVYSYDGSWHLYNANTLAHVRALTPLGGDAEPQWHPTDPNTLYYLPTNGGTKLLKVDVRNNSTATVVDFVGKLPSWAANAAHIWTRSEGSPSADGRYWGFLVYDNSWRMLGFIVWDLQQNKLAGSRASSKEQDNASMSASGRWFIESGADGTWAWSRDFTSKKKIDQFGIHSDLAIAANGNDYYVTADYESSNGDVYFVDLDTCPNVPASATSAPLCPRTVLFSQYPTGGWASMHFSAKSFNKPGWVLISTYDAQTNTGSLPWFANKIMAVELKASPKVYMLAYTRRVAVTSGDTTGAGNYWAEPHASVNRDFTRIAFNTNWNNAVGADIDTYMIELPAGAIGGGAPPASGPRTGGTLPALPVGGSNAAVPVSGAAASVASPPATPAPASTPLVSANPEAFSIGCPACRYVARARVAMSAVAGYAWAMAQPNLRALSGAFDRFFELDEPEARPQRNRSTRTQPRAAAAPALPTAKRQAAPAKNDAAPAKAAAPDRASDQDRTPASERKRTLPDGKRAVAAA